jgi:integrase
MAALAGQHRWQLRHRVSRRGAAITRFGQFLTHPQVGVDRLVDIDRGLLERYLADLHQALAGKTAHKQHIGSLNAFFQAIRRHGWDNSLPPSAMFFLDDYPKRTHGRLPRALAEQVMAQVENPANLDRWDDPARRLITVILIRCGLRISDAAKLPYDCIVTDPDGAPYLKYFNHKMKREALVPIDEELTTMITRQQGTVRHRWPNSTAVLFPRMTTNPDGSRPYSAATYRSALYRWLKLCDIRDEHGSPVHLTPHQWRHTLGTRLINRDVPQEVVRRILDHDSAEMTAHYARLHDTTVRRHWEAARKVNINGEVVTFDPNGPLAEAAWAKQRLSRATQAHPNGYCGLPMIQSCPHANSCLTCPMFPTTAEFLPQHRQQHQQTLRIISTAQARGHTRMVEMNRQVADNLERIITGLEADNDDQQVADAS